ncbi:MAG: hypothetical protein M3264_10790 [Thermoproteota archaeon]|nr:hypothetical protein [Thermoproteota archaeon]
MLKGDKPLFFISGTLTVQSSTSPLCRSYGADNKQGTEDKEDKAYALCSFFKFKKELHLTPSLQIGLVLLLLAASTVRPKAAGER